jgi:hypothetical protein
MSKGRGVKQHGLSIRCKEFYFAGGRLAVVWYEQVAARPGRILLVSLGISDSTEKKQQLEDRRVKLVRNSTYGYNNLLF